MFALIHILVLHSLYFFPDAEETYQVTSSQIGLISGIAGTMVVIIIIATIAGVLFAVKRRGNGESVGMNMKQRFHKPRINQVA